MFSFRKKDKQTAKEPQAQAPPSVLVEDYLNDSNVVRILELEEKVADLSYNLKHVEELVQLYAVVPRDAESGRVLRWGPNHASGSLLQRENHKSGHHDHQEAERQQRRPETNLFLQF